MFLVQISFCYIIVSLCGVYCTLSDQQIDILTYEFNDGEHIEWNCYGSITPVESPSQVFKYYNSEGLILAASEESTRSPLRFQQLMKVHHNLSYIDCINKDYTDPYVKSVICRTKFVLKLATNNNSKSKNNGKYGTNVKYLCTYMHQEILVSVKNVDKYYYDVLWMGLSADNILNQYTKSEYEWEINYQLSENEILKLSCVRGSLRKFFLNEIAANCTPNHTTHTTHYDDIIFKQKIIQLGVTTRIIIKFHQKPSIDLLKKGDSEMPTIIGAAIGVLCGLLIIVAAIYWYKKREVYRTQVPLPIINNFDTPMPAISIQRESKECEYDYCHDNEYDYAIDLFLNSREKQSGITEVSNEAEHYYTEIKDD